MLSMEICSRPDYLDYLQERKEKPWQRVPNVFLLLVLAGYLTLAFLVQLIEDDMPTVIQEKDVPPDREIPVFSEEAAWRYLHTITGNYPRVAGTKYHLEKTEDLKQLLDSIADNSSIPIHTDWQMVSGDFPLSRLAPVNSYQNLTNIVALLEGQSGFHSNGTVGSSILINCHYDSVAFALGASDNAIFCAVMVEALSRLAKGKQLFKHNIIFLFNGAEENPLQGSHAFLKHPWSKTSYAVVNLDSCGTNGKPNLFQVTDPRVLNAYARVTSRPSAQSVGEVMFSSGLIPSDTDFRVWRDFGNILGVDIAFVKWGLVYHTRNDNLDWIRPGVIQNAGNMLLALIKELGDDAELETKVNPSAAVYYDYLNLFMLTYSMSVAHVVDTFILLVALGSVVYYAFIVGWRRSTLQELGVTCLWRLAAMAAGVGVVLLLTLIVMAFPLQLRYLSHAWIVVPLYWIPYLMVNMAVTHYRDDVKGGLTRSLRTLRAMASSRLVLALFLLILLVIPTMATMRYIVSVPLLLTSVVSFLSLAVNKYYRLKAYQHLFLEIVLSVPCFIFLCSLALRLDALMLPIMGRSPNNNPDFTVAIINLALAMITLAPLSGIELLFSRNRVWIVLGTVFSACVVVSFIPMQQYVEPTTQRQVWFHTSISDYDFYNVRVNQRNGVLISKLDAYTTATVERTFSDLDIAFNVHNISERCDSHVYCDLPLYRPSLVNTIKNSVFLSVGPPAAFTPQPLVQLYNQTCLGNTCTFQFGITGAPHNIITIRPHSTANLTGWSFDSPPEPCFQLQNRPVYVISHSIPTYSETMVPFILTLVFRVNTVHQEQPIVDISHHAHQIQHPEVFTDEYKWLIEPLPDYCSLQTYLTFRNNYVF